MMKKEKVFVYSFQEITLFPLVFIPIFLSAVGINVKISLSKRIIIITSDLYSCHHRVRQLENPAIK